MYSFEEFLERVKISDGLVCYGVGKRFRTFEQSFPEIILNKVVFCIDRDKKLEKIVFDNRIIDVKSVETLQEMKKKNIVLLITNLRYDEVISDLSKENFLNGIDYYCFTHLYGMFLEEKAMKKKIPLDCRLTKKPIIPKIIHYCWFGENPIPEKYKKYMESWHRYCPDYEIKEWNESNYDITKNQYMYEAYKSKKWGFVPDYIRLDLISEFGGIYLDTDVELVKSLDDMLYQKGFAGFEQESAVALGLGFGAIKGLPIIKEMRDVYNNLHFINATGELNLTTSPEYQTNFLIKKGLQLNGEYQKIENLVIYPEKMFSGKSIYTRRVRLTSYTKSIHHYDASWADDKQRRRNIKFELEMNG